MATSPLRSRRSPEEGTKSEVAASPLPSWGPTSGQNCFATPTFSRVPGSGDKIRSGYIAPALLGAHKLLCHRNVLGGPYTRGPNQKWLHRTCLLGCPQGRGIAMSNLRYRGPEKRGQNQKWMHRPCPVGSPEVAGIAVSPLRSRGSQEEGTQWELATLPLPSRGPTSGRAGGRAGSLGSTKGGTKSEATASPLPSQGPMSGHNCCVTLAFSGVPRRGQALIKHYPKAI